MSQKNRYAAIRYTNLNCIRDNLNRTPMTTYQIPSTKYQVPFHHVQHLRTSKAACPKLYALCAVRDMSLFPTPPSHLKINGMLRISTTSASGMLTNRLFRLDRWDDNKGRKNKHMQAASHAGILFAKSTAE